MNVSLTAEEKYLKNVLGISAVLLPENLLKDQSQVSKPSDFGHTQTNWRVFKKASQSSLISLAASQDLKTTEAMIQKIHVALGQPDATFALALTNEASEFSERSQFMIAFGEEAFTALGFSEDYISSLGQILDLPNSRVLVTRCMDEMISGLNVQSAKAEVWAQLQKFKVEFK